MVWFLKSSFKKHNMVPSHPNLQLQSARRKALTAIIVIPFAGFFGKVSTISTCDFIHYLFLITLSEWSASQLVENEKIFAAGSKKVE